jgi:hypothetical protein
VSCLLLFAAVAENHNLVENFYKSTKYEKKKKFLFGNLTFLYRQTDRQRDRQTDVRTDVTRLTIAVHKYFTKRQINLLWEKNSDTLNWCILPPEAKCIYSKIRTLKLLICCLVTLLCRSWMHWWIFKTHFVSYVRRHLGDVAPKSIRISI